MSAPNQFDRDAYNEVRDLIRANAKCLPAGAEEWLAEIAGGVELVAAIRPTAFPPCPIENDCGECWVHEWCTHSSVDPEIRTQLRDSITTLAESGVEFNQAAIDLILACDKASNHTAARAVSAMRILLSVLENQNDKAKNAI
jgi:hypothetical protein